jgi:hypothetical protein
VLIAVPFEGAPGDAAPTVGAETALFKAPYHIGANTMYDVSPDGKRFVIVVQPGNEPANW